MVEYINRVCGTDICEDVLDYKSIERLYKGVLKGEKVVPYHYTYMFQSTVDHIRREWQRKERERQLREQQCK